MRITGIEVVPFLTETIGFWNGQLWPTTEVIQTVTKVTTDVGVEGYYIGGGIHGDRDGLSAHDRELLRSVVGPLLTGVDALDRERVWQWCQSYQLPEVVASVVDLALWDLAGRAAGLPVHKLLGGCREYVKAYASTFNNMGTPEQYAEHALECKSAGYGAYKIHPYYFCDPSTLRAAPPRPSHIDADVAVCRAVREAVGSEMTLMFDPWGTYHNYADAYRVGRELEELDFYWYEHPMPEYRVESYIKLANELAIPICSPEVAAGGVYTRADWIARKASDISRIDVLRGGITGAMKTVAVAEAFGVRCEIHMSGFGNLQVLGATSEDVCEYYERGLLAPGNEYDAPLPYLEKPCDALRADGTVEVPKPVGMGYEIAWDYVDDRTLSERECLEHQQPSFVRPPANNL